MRALAQMLRELAGYFASSVVRPERSAWYFQFPADSVGLRWSSMKPVLLRALNARDTLASDSTRFSLSVSSVTRTAVGLHFHFEVTSSNKCPKSWLGTSTAYETDVVWRSYGVRTPTRYVGTGDAFGLCNENNIPRRDTAQLQRRPY